MCSNLGEGRKVVCLNLGECRIFVLLFPIHMGAIPTSGLCWYRSHVCMVDPHATFVCVVVFGKRIFGFLIA